MRFIGYVKAIYRVYSLFMVYFIGYQSYLSIARFIGLSLVFGIYFSVYYIHLISFLKAISILLTTNNQPIAIAV